MRLISVKSIFAIPPRQLRPLGFFRCTVERGEGHRLPDWPAARPRPQPPLVTTRRAGTLRSVYGSDGGPAASGRGRSWRLGGGSSASSRRDSPLVPGRADSRLSRGRRCRKGARPAGGPPRRLRRPSPASPRAHLFIKPTLIIGCKRSTARLLWLPALWPCRPCRPSTGRPCSHRRATCGESPSACPRPCARQGARRRCL